MVRYNKLKQKNKTKIEKFLMKSYIINVYLIFLKLLKLNKLISTIITF